MLTTLAGQIDSESARTSTVGLAALAVIAAAAFTVYWVRWGRRERRLAAEHAAAVATYRTEMAANAELRAATANLEAGIDEVNDAVDRLTATPRHQATVRIPAVDR